MSGVDVLASPAGSPPLAHRGRYEVEAESVAYIVVGILGLHTSDYSTGYVAHWAENADADVIKDTAARVLAAAHALVETVTPREQRLRIIDHIDQLNYMNTSTRQTSRTKEARCSPSERRRQATGWTA